MKIQTKIIKRYFVSNKTKFFLKSKILGFPVNSSENVTHYKQKCELCVILNSTFSQIYLYKCVTYSTK